MIISFALRPFSMRNKLTPPSLTINVMPYLNGPDLRLRRSFNIELVEVYVEPFHIK